MLLFDVIYLFTSHLTIFNLYVLWSIFDSIVFAEDTQNYGAYNYIQIFVANSELIKNLVGTFFVAVNPN